jgi:TM2 domain-containing membrane protein YozV
MKVHPLLDQEGFVAAQGSAGNVIAAVCSFFVPGLGQLVQGRLGMAILQFVLAAVLWFFLLGWIIHLWSILDAALWKPKTP